MSKCVAVDFDGTIHPYSKGWTGSEPDDEPPIPGAEQFIMRLLTDGYRVAIFSTRADHLDGEQGIIRWIGKHMRQVFYAMRDDGVVTVTAQKPAAVAYVDDRAVPLRAPGPLGSWEDVWARVRGDVDALANGRAHGAAPPVPEHADHPHGSVVEQVHRVLTSEHGLDPWALAEEVVRFVESRAAGVVRGG